MKGLWGRGLALAGLGAFLIGCGYISFGRRVTDDEMLLQQEILDFYNGVQRAFAAGNPDALAGLFSPSITHPMTHKEIHAWAEKFFGENKNASFRIEKLAFEQLGHVQAVVTLSYQVETQGGKGDFGGTERDTLVKHRRHWYISSWEKAAEK